MKVVLPVEEDQKTICISFGRTPGFLVVDTETKEETYFDNDAINAQGGAGIQAAQWIVNQKVDALLTPRCGENAAKVLQVANIKMYKTTSNSVETEIDNYCNQTLVELYEIHQGFHRHGGR